MFYTGHFANSGCADGSENSLMDTGVGMNVKSAAVCRFFLLGLGFLISSQSVAEVGDYACGSLDNARVGHTITVWVTIVWNRSRVNHLSPDVVNLVKGTNGHHRGGSGFRTPVFSQPPCGLVFHAEAWGKGKAIHANGCQVFGRMLFQARLDVPSR